MTFMMTFTIILGLTFTRCCLHLGVSVHFFIHLFNFYLTYTKHFTAEVIQDLTEKKKLNGEVI